MTNKIAYITMVSASTYYFDSNEDKDGSASVRTAITFAYIKNFGSIALGSLIQSLIAILDILLNSQDQNEGQEGPAAIIGACFRCCLRCFGDILDYLNVIGLANMSISGDSYCKSAWNGFMLNLKQRL